MSGRTMKTVAQRFPTFRRHLTNYIKCSYLYPKWVHFRRLAELLLSGRSLSKEPYGR